MKFIVKGPFKDNIYSLMRKLGYHFINKDEGTSEYNFIRPFRSYPRFHIYLKVENENLIFNLHLDQKRPIYKGTIAHSGEYDGEVVEKEVKKVKEILNKAI